MVVSKVWYVAKTPNGIPKKEDFLCKEEELPPCGEGEAIVEAEYLSVDPYQRYIVRQIPTNSVMAGTSVGRVIESKNSNWPVGSYLVCNTGWRTHSVMKKDVLDKMDFLNGCSTITKNKDYSLSLNLGVLGMPGATAYFGLLEICKPQAGETVLVNGAAGAVGSLVVQIAKIKGCKVIAFAGSDEKVAYVKELGADFAFNYKTVNVSEVLEQAAPEKINCYFDNVGGLFTAEAFPYMAEFGRVSVCGAISTYNDESKDIGKVALTSPFSEGTLIWRQLRVEGFIVSRWKAQWNDCFEQHKKWISEGKMKFRETVTEGFDKMPEAFIGLFLGENFGKAVVKP